MEVRALSQAKQDGEHKRKKLEGQVADLQSRFNDSEKQKAELGDRCAKTTVNKVFTVIYLAVLVFKAKMLTLICLTI